MFAQLGAMGVSVLFASGDSGVGGGSCQSNGTDRVKFIPVFPASCGLFYLLLQIHMIYLIVVTRPLRHDSWWHDSSEPRGGS